MKHLTLNIKSKKNYENKKARDNSKDKKMERWLWNLYLVKVQDLSDIDAFHFRSNQHVILLNA